MSQVRHYFGRAKQGVMLVVLGLFSFSVAQATESILDFHSDISVNRDGSIEVIETITVNAEGRDIRRGIYRDLPTDYEHPQYGKFGFKSKAPISVVSVQRNGVDEPYHTQDLDNGLRVFFGSASRYLKHGEHTYRLRYTAERQIAVSDSTARLYWNVTGNGWMFPIQRASAKIHLPGQSSVYQQDVFTGYQGSSSTDALFDSADDADIFIQSAKPLLARQGMTVKVQFDASELVLPEQSELALLYYDNALWFWGVGLLALMVILLFFFWVRIGRDPQRGIVIAQYRPVKDLSAAAHRAVFRNRVDDTSFSVGVLSAAIKGWLTISEPSKKTFKLTSTEANQADRKPLSPSENLLVKGLFNGRDSVTLDGEYDNRLKTLKSRYDEFLQKEFANKSHQPHTVPLVLGGLVGIVGLALMASVGLRAMEDAVGVIITLFVVLSIALPIVLRKMKGSLGYSLSITGLALAAACVYYANTPMAIALTVFGLVLGVFSYLMPAPKQVAVKTLDEIEGFRLYLSKAEHESLKRLDLPEKTPQLYEELLPFAIALDLETEWSDQFTEVLAAANWDSDKNSRRSHWYSGNNRSSMNSFAPAIAAGLASSVVAASTPPSSSSSGGGGFSGGGGGGGGGGGW